MKIVILYLCMSFFLFLNTTPVLAVFGFIPGGASSYGTVNASEGPLDGLWEYRMHPGFLIPALVFFFEFRNGLVLFSTSGERGLEHLANAIYLDGAPDLATGERGRVRWVFNASGCSFIDLNYIHHRDGSLDLRYENSSNDPQVRIYRSYLGRGIRLRRRS